jgi:hypothetical protein
MTRPSRALRIPVARTALALTGALLWALAPACSSDEDDASGGDGPASGSGGAGATGASGTGANDIGGGEPGGSGPGGSGSGGEPGAGGGGGDCAGDTHECNGQCVPNDDPAYACGDPSCSPCAVPHATAACSGGACVVGTCDASYQDCNAMAGDGCETNTDGDPSNCSTCGNVCPGGNAAICDNGTCDVSDCPAGTGDCDADPATCETDLDTSVADCGYCGNTCVLSHATPDCAAGQCVIASCSGGFADCDGADANGCEIDTDTNPDHCGACGVDCASGSCSGGNCQSVCGDGVIGGAEECDDGDTEPLDGCNPSCKYEMVQRVTTMTVQNGASPNWCVPSTNQFGSALTTAAKDSFNDTLKTDVDAGTLNILMQYLALDDLTGQDDGAFEIGMLSGTPDPDKGAWVPPGSIDWWFLAVPSTVDANGLPIERIKPGSIAGGNVQAGPNTTAIFFLGNFLTMRDARARATIGSATNVPAPPPPGLASGLTAFQTTSAATSSLGLCGNITVASLANVPAPQALTTSGSFTSRCRSSCSNSLEYTYCGAGNPVTASCNSLLDVVVGGCRAVLCSTVIYKKQPDVGAGSSPPAAISNDASKNNKVTIVEPNDAYSSYFQFQTTRAHLTNNL